MNLVFIEWMSVAVGVLSLFATIFIACCCCKSSGKSCNIVLGSGSIKRKSRSSRPPVYDEAHLQQMEMIWNDTKSIKTPGYTPNGPIDPEDYAESRDAKL